MIKTGTIAVVIPVYNRKDELVRALRSVFHQTVAVDEVWVVDDASDIQLFPIDGLEHWSALHYHRLPNRSNANVARNKGAALSNSDFIAFLDSDDEWEPNYLASCWPHLKKSPGAYFSGAKVIRNGEAIQKKSLPWHRGSSAINFLLDGGFAQTSSFIVDRHSFAEVRFDESLKRHQDFDFFVRYDKAFTWEQLPVCAVLVHWEENRKVTRDASSEMTFIARFADEISPRVLKRYLRMQYDYFFLHGQPSDYRLHQAFLPSIIDQLTFSEYKSFFKERPGWYRNTILGLHYIWCRLKG
ncbi:MAG: hypothetical protein RLY35_806 [Bacteroidota bacterium]|jgi:glycosyltransferase involved in cell wall biosynthesis